jgi:hypothetical protein
MAPTAAAMLAAWEVGAASAPIDRAPTLLRSLNALPADVSVARLTVGQCDARLFALRRALFGDALEAVSTCPVCDAEIELVLALDQLQPEPIAEPSPAITVSEGGYTVSCRIPLNDDLGALARQGESARVEDLVERCAIEAHDATGAVIPTEQLPPQTAHAVLEALAANDPGAHTPIAIRCPCGAEWVDELDIRAITWADLTDWVSATLTEVHQLARAYGWSEADILAMSATRRRWYLEAAGW